MSKNTSTVQDSEARVAFDLMMQIKEKEGKYAEGYEDNPRAYYLRLYRECLSAVTNRAFHDLK